MENLGTEVTLGQLIVAIAFIGVLALFCKGENAALRVKICCSLSLSLCCSICCWEIER